MEDDKEDDGSLSSQSTIPCNVPALRLLGIHNPSVELRIMCLTGKPKVIGFFNDYFFRSDTPVNLGIRANDSIEAFTLKLSDYLLETNEVKAFDNFNLGIFCFIKSKR